MKKLIPLFTLLLFITSCGKADVTPQLTNIGFSADICYYNENYKGDCTVSEDGAFKITLTEPESLAGYTVTVEKDKITAEYLGLSFTPTKNNMPQSSVMTEFYEKYTAAAQIPPEKKGDNLIIKGGDGIGAYTLYISPTGLPQKMTLPDERFTVYFYNATVL